MVQISPARAATHGKDDSEEGGNWMSKRAIRIVKHMGSVPCVAACTACGMEFKAPLSALARVKDAQANLQTQFDRHQCTTTKE
jgi:hypothetical protein